MSQDDQARALAVLIRANYAKEPQDHAHARTAAAQTLVNELAEVAKKAGYKVSPEGGTGHTIRKTALGGAFVGFDEDGPRLHNLKTKDNVDVELTYDPVAKIFFYNSDNERSALVHMATLLAEVLEPYTPANS